MDIGASGPTPSPDKRDEEMSYFFTNSFTDKNVSKEKLYFYQLASVSKANIEGVKSEKISVRL